MLKRIFYTFNVAIRYRHELKNAIINDCIDSLNSLELDIFLKNSTFNTYILAIDYDGVLSSHGKVEICKKSEQWLKDAINFPSIKNIYIYSNKPNMTRINYFKENFKEIKFLSNMKKKPYIDGISKIINEELVSPKAIIVIDDRLLTGILAAITAGTNFKYVKKPIRDFKNSFCKEIFFCTLRFLEKKIILLICKF